MPELHPHWVGDHSTCPPESSCTAAGQARAELERALEPRAGEKVCIGVPHLDQAGWNFTESVLRMVAYDKQHGNHLMHNSGLMNNGALCPVWGRGGDMPHARNTAAAAFLSSGSDWLLWWDSDIGAEQEALEKLLAVADPETAPIVGGLCFIETDYSHDWRGGLRSGLAPTLYDWAWVEPRNGAPGAYKMLTRAKWPTNEVTRVGATGTGFLLTHRSVYEKISRWLVDQGAPPHIWFERVQGPDGERCGEDVSFCLRAHQIGLPILVHTGVVTSHQKTVWYSLADYALKPFTPQDVNTFPLGVDQWPKMYANRNAAQDAARESPIRERQAPEATEEVAIIVPVARRDNAATFLSSLAESLTEGQRERVTVYAMADLGDDVVRAGWEGQRETYPNLIMHFGQYPGEMGSFAQKVNVGYRNTKQPWLFLVGDDVRFHRGWLNQVMETARTSGKHVIGTNDLGNPAVLAGDHATHMMIRRRYVDETGASWDGPGTVAHEGYRHWYVDNEIVEAAKQVDAWVPCLAAHVEHLHPYWRKGEYDDVYRIGEQAADRDAELWKTRLAAHRDPLVVRRLDGKAIRMFEGGQELADRLTEVAGDGGEFKYLEPPDPSWH